MRLSASQVQTFIDCPRKWSWRYVLGVEEPPNAAAERGTLVHTELGKYLNGGEIDFTTEIGYIAAAGLHHLPKPGAVGLLVEQEFHFEGPSGHSYLGYKDLELPGFVYDHKTTSDLRWQKTVEELRDDIQATLYAVDYFRNHPNEPTVELRWVYYQTKNARKSAVTAIAVNQIETWQRFLKIEQIAADMSAVSDKHPLDLPPNVNHCSAYGGCPHQGRCNLSPFDKMRSHVEQNKLLMALKNKKNGVAAGPSEAPTATPVSSVVPAGSVPSRAFAPGGAHHGVLPNPLLARLHAGGAPAADLLPAVNPPEHQPPPPPPSAEAAGAELAASLKQDDAPARGRGRPPKAAAPSAGLAEKIKVLYVNCGPVGVAVPDATGLIALAKKRVGLADYRFAEYGQGPGMLAVAIVQELEGLEGVLPALRLDSTTPEGSVVAVELMARAGMVVR